MSSLLKMFYALIGKKVVNKQILTNDLDKILAHFRTDKEDVGTLLGKRIYTNYNPIPFSHLSMRTEIPNAIATYHPKIEDEFVIAKVSAWRKEQKGTDKVIKRKTKKLEKEAVRELRKDTQAI